ncbi:MAG TPA: hypothetical protein VJR89_27010 [Polyangiales bacterium]|nr:hypothetical protein [Polyangiales bacterium]
MTNVRWLAELLSDRPSGFIENTQDAVISQFQRGGVNDCKGQFLTDTPEPAVFKADVIKREAFPNCGAFIVEGTTHTYLRTNNFYTQRTAA